MDRVEVGTGIEVECGILHRVPPLVAHRLHLDSKLVVHRLRQLVHLFQTQPIVRDVSESVDIVGPRSDEGDAVVLSLLYDDPVVDGHDGDWAESWYRDIDEDVTNGVP